jgi:hypothetical protein
MHSPRQAAPVVEPDLWLTLEVLLYSVRRPALLVNDSLAGLRDKRNLLDRVRIEHFIFHFHVRFQGLKF